MLIRTIVGLFNTQAEAEEALKAIEQTDFCRCEFTLITDPSAENISELLAGLGFSEALTEFYITRLEEGGVLLLVQTDRPRVPIVERIMRQKNAVEPHSRANTRVVLPDKINF